MMAEEAEACEPSRLSMVEVEPAEPGEDHVCTGDRSGVRGKEAGYTQHRKRAVAATMINQPRVRASTWIP
jgi:hypothetical protein